MFGVDALSQESIESDSFSLGDYTITGIFLLVLPLAEAIFSLGHHSQLQVSDDSTNSGPFLKSHCLTRWLSWTNSF